MPRALLRPQVGQDDCSRPARRAQKKHVGYLLGCLGASSGCAASAAAFVGGGVRATRLYRVLLHNVVYLKHKRDMCTIFFLDRKNADMMHDVPNEDPLLLGYRMYGMCAVVSVL